jgi:hypothetical protein
MLFSNVLKFHLPFLFNLHIFSKISSCLGYVAINEHFFALSNFLYRIMTKIVFVKNLITLYDIPIFIEDQLKNVIYLPFADKETLLFYASNF